eukprot:3133488-Pyramimonas_sp.AAC.1
MTSFYGSSCANNGKDALNTPEEGVYTLRGDQSTERKEYIPREGTNRPRRRSIYLERGPIATERRKEYIPGKCARDAAARRGCSAAAPQRGDFR